MTIASKTNLLRMGFMVLELGKGLTADYTNNADSKGGLRRMTNKKVSAVVLTLSIKSELTSGIRVIRVIRG